MRFSPPCSLIPLLLVSGNLIAGEPVVDLAGRRWHELQPLPDAVGFGGMFVAVLDGKLVVGGGSQFRDKPRWQGGEKSFSDRIFVLESIDGDWLEHTARLPVEVGHFAAAATEDAIYLAGGVNSTGCLRQVLRVEKRDDTFTFTRLPDLPHPLAYTTAEIVAGRLYVVGGITTPDSKSASAELWSLEINTNASDAKWERLPPLPGPGTHVASSANDGRNLYLIGGIGFDDDSMPTPSSAVYRFDTKTRTWDRLEDLPEPRVGPAAPCPVFASAPTGPEIFVIGGYASVFPGPPREHPGFAAETLLYNITRQTTRTGPHLPNSPVHNRDSPGDPGPAPMIAAPCCIWQNHIVVVGGEVRASVRTPSVLALPISDVQQDANSASAAAP